MAFTDFIAELVNHLWQSTAVVALAWFLALALRRNQARVRYWIWCAASVKFLLPFSLLISVGEWLRSQIRVPAATSAVNTVVEQVTQSFVVTQNFSAAAPVEAHGIHWWFWILLAAWGCGALLVATRFGLAWWKMYGAKRASRRVEIAADVPVLLSPTLIEPGVFGIFHPVLLMPEGILERLSAEQMSVIVAHEICHVRRRDNLTFAMHMLVETLFWFHPAIWWIGARLIDERERACDEAVVQGGGSAEIYAESILNVCKFYVESPVVCAAGVTGADLKKRIVHIMAGQWGLQLTWHKKILIATVVLAVLSVPMALGLVNLPRFRAQMLRAPSGPPASFEVATVKPSDPGETGLSFSIKFPYFAARHATLKSLIKFAYDAKSDDQIIDGPDWMNKEFFDIEAKSGSNEADQFRKLPPEHKMDPARLLLQTLLAERFRMKASIKMKSISAYALVIAKGGPKLKPGEGEIPHASTPSQNSDNGLRIPTLHLTGPHQFTGKGAPINMLIGWLEFQDEIGGRPIVDETGLQGGYDFVLEGVPGPPLPAGAAMAPPQNDQPSIFTVLQEQLGLKLVPKKLPVEVLVIDHVEQPSPN